MNPAKPPGFSSPSAPGIADLSAAPRHAATILRGLLRRPPEALDLDWFGTFPIIGLLRWADRGYPEARAYAQAWFNYHAQQPPGVVDARCAPPSRVCRLTHVSVRTYAGFWGLGIAAAALHRANGEPRARATAVDVADMIVHNVARHGNGLIAHDDLWDCQIPDTCYFAVDALMEAARFVEPAVAAVYRRQALVQLRAYVSAVFNREKGLAHTMLLPTGKPGTTYWCRATGWLMWALCAGRRGVVDGSPEAAEITGYFEQLTRGAMRALDSTGGFHVLMDRPETPPEVTSVCMVATALDEAVRCGWLGTEFRAPVVNAMWPFILRQIQNDTHLASVYVAWAKPAEEGRVGTESIPLDGFGPGIGMLLLALSDMTKAPNT